MMKNLKNFNSGWIWIIAILLAVILISLAPLYSKAIILFLPIPLWVMFVRFDSKGYWAISALLAFILYLFSSVPFVIIFSCQALLVGVFSEAIKNKISILWSGFLGCLSAVGVGAVSLSFWSKSTGIRFLDLVKEEIEQMSQLVGQNGTKLIIDSEMLFRQLPSGAIIIMILTLSLIIKFGHKFAENKYFKSDLIDKFDKDFTLPGFYIWALLIAILGGLLKNSSGWIQTISLNALNILIVLFFFQGMSVIGCFFRIYRIGQVWQAIWYILFIFRFILVVSLIGFSDYWVGYRERLVRRAAKTEKTVLK